jgi:peptidyl-prolyl cis-trans isomerase SurA
MVYPFETAAYNTSVGTISMPVRTQFGYHIIKVIDRTPYLGQKQSAHIIIRVGPTYSAKDTSAAIAKINEIYSKLKAGEDFGTLASQYSDDPGSSKKGGDLGAGKLLGEMEEIKRKLGKGEISKPFTTQFGWHILKVTEITPLKPYDQAKNELKSRVSKDLRSNLTQEIFINKLKKLCIFFFIKIINKQNRFF